MGYTKRVNEFDNYLSEEILNNITEQLFFVFAHELVA